MSFWKAFGSWKVFLVALAAMSAFEFGILNRKDPFWASIGVLAFIGGWLISTWWTWRGSNR